MQEDRERRSLRKIPRRQCTEGLATTSPPFLESDRGREGLDSLVDGLELSPEACLGRDFSIDDIQRGPI